MLNLATAWLGHSYLASHSATNSLGNGLVEHSKQMHTYVLSPLFLVGPSAPQGRNATEYARKRKPFCQNAIAHVLRAVYSQADNI